MDGGGVSYTRREGGTQGLQTGVDGNQREIHGCMPFRGLAQNPLQGPQTPVQDSPVILTGMAAFDGDCAKSFIYRGWSLTEQHGGETSLPDSSLSGFSCPSPLPPDFKVQLCPASSPEDGLAGLCVRSHPPR